MRARITIKLVDPATRLIAWLGNARPSGATAELLLEGTEDGIGHSIAPAVALTAHALDDARTLLGLDILGARVLGAVVDYLPSGQSIGGKVHCLRPPRTRPTHPRTASGCAAAG